MAGKVEQAETIANHESSRTTRLRDLLGKNSSSTIEGIRIRVG